MNGFQFKIASRVWWVLVSLILVPGLALADGYVPAAAGKLHPTGQLPATQQLRLALSLPLRHRADLTNLLQRLYDPASPDFHQFLTPEQFAERFGPAANDYQALGDFLRGRGFKITGTHPNRSLLDVAGSVADIEQLLRVTLRVYPHPREARSFFAPDAEPALDFPMPVLHISGLDDYLRPRPMNLHAEPVNTTKKPAYGSGPGGGYLGNDFRAAYLPGSPLTGSGQSVGLLEFDGYYSNDVAAYRHEAGLGAVPLKNIILDNFTGLPGANNSEVALDIDMASCMAPGLAAILVYEGQTPDDILNRMATDNLARQLSASWLYPIDPETEQIFLQFAAQGQSFFNAAGDYDAYAGAVDPPADDPNITVVGGTTLQTAGAGGAWLSESVWNWGDGTGTGGGISTTYPIPSWQAGVSMSLNHGSTNLRNLPDVALTADNVWLIYDNGATGTFGGTSCATPLWAAFTALINQQAAANGKPPAGFLNPALYALGRSSNYAAAFHDMTTGNNTSASSPNNFYAVPGYDLCTGWGTPTGPALINLLAPPDALVVSPAAGLNASGGAGGPFAPPGAIFILTDGGTNAVNWSLGGGAPWLTVSPSGGKLAPGGPAAVVTVQFNAQASNQVAGVYTASLYLTNLSSGLAQSRPCTLSVVTPPAITLAPQSQALLGGATAQFTAGAVGGAPLSYQWQQNGANLTDGGNISGSSTTVLTISNVALSDAGLYAIVVSNAAAAVISAPPALLTIVPSGPVITVPPASQYALAGATVQFGVAAEGDAPMSYQWQQNGTNLADGAGISGSSTATLTLEPATAASGGTYTVVLTNDLGAAASAPAVLSVYALSDTELLQNGGFEAGNFSGWNLSGNDSFETVAAGPLFTRSGLYGAEMGPVDTPGFISQTVPTTPGATYLLSLWLDSPDGDGPNEFIVNWNGYDQLALTNMTAFGWSNFQFALTATAASTTVELGFRDDTSFLGLDDVSLKPLLNPAGAPVITGQPPAQTFAAVGASASLTVTATGLAPLFYQWLSNNVAIPGATSPTLAFSSVNTNQDATYSLRVNNVLGSAASSNAVLSVLTGAPVLVTFDDLGPTNLPVPNGYAGLAWSNFYHTDTGLSAPNPSGYIAGTISPPNVAFNQYGTAASITNDTPFDFLSAWVTAAWNDNLRLEARGYAGGALVYDQAYFLSSETPSFLQFNCVGVTNIEFTSSGGTPNQVYGGSGFEFVMDNASVIVNTPPPPANDQCAGAFVASGDPYTNAQSTLGATSMGDPVPTCLSGFANGVWYQFTAPTNGILVIDTSGSDFNACVALYSGSCGALTQLSCNENTAAMQAGQTVYILVGAIGNVTGQLVLRLSFSSATTGPPFILSSPASVSVSAGRSASFSVSAEGQAPLNYTWEKNGGVIAGATGATYATNNIVLTDSGAQFTCVVSNALGAAASAAATLLVNPPEQLVQNGGFETGDFSYWTESGNFTDCYVNNLFVHSGQYGAALGPVGAPGYLSQALGTLPGQLYQVSLWLDSPDGLTNNQFLVQWNGATLFDEVNLPRLGWTNLQFNVPATTTSTMLQLGFRDDPSFLGLDDVSVLPLMPVLQGVGEAGGALTFQWSALPGSVYQVQSATNLASGFWTPVGSSITATNYTVTTIEPIASGPAQFYRIVLLP